MPEIKHPDVTVQLTGEDGNAFAVLGKVSRALKDAGYGDETAAFMAEATGGDYDHLLGVCQQWVNVE